MGLLRLVAGAGAAVSCGRTYAKAAAAAVRVRRVGSVFHIN